MTIIDKNAEYIPAKKPDYSVRSIPGTNLLSNYPIGKEKNPILLGRNKAEIFDEMLSTDPAISRAYTLLRQTLTSATFKFIPASEDDEQSMALCKFMNQVFGLGGEVSYLQEGSFESILEQICLYLPYGYQYLEEIYYQHKDQEGNDRVFLKTLAHCEATAHLRWGSDDGRNLSYIQQLSSVGGVNSEKIPANKVLLFVLNKSGSNFEGVGLLRPCYYYWREKQSILNIASLGISRWAAPTPVLSIDRTAVEAIGYSDEEVSQMIEQAAQQAANYSALEQSFLIENQVIKFQVFGGSSSGFDLSQVNEYIQTLDNQIASAFLSNFMNLGITQTGARAVGTIHQEFFILSCINILEYICSIIGGADRPGAGLVGRLIKFNFGDIPLSKYPKLVAGGLDSDELGRQLFNLPTLVQSGLLQPDNTLLSGVREKLGLPPVKQEQNQPQQPIVGGTPNE